MYSMDNFMKTYEELAVFYNTLQTKEVTKMDIIVHLNTKGLVPSSIINKIRKNTCCSAKVVGKDGKSRLCKNVVSLGHEKCAVHMRYSNSSKRTNKKKHITLKELREMDSETLESMMDTYIEKKGDRLVGLIDSIIEDNPRRRDQLAEVRKLDHFDAIDIYKLITVLGEIRRN